MRFNVPPGWPDAPIGWVPDAGWRPDPGWPLAPEGWRFWTHDDGSAAAAPAGLFPGRNRRRPKVLLGAASGFAGLVLGIGIGGGGAESTNTAQVTLPVSTVTTTVATPGPVTTSVLTITGPTTTVRPPAVTQTVRATVTRTVRTTVTAAAPLVGSGGEDTGGYDSGGDGGSVYYANCSEARAAGVTPLHIGEPGYRSGLDRDKDGVACE